MSGEDILTGSETAPSPSEYTPAPPEAPPLKSHAEIVKAQFDRGLQIMAHGVEDITDYAREKADQDAYEKDADISPSRMAEWHARTHDHVRRMAEQQARDRGETPPQVPTTLWRAS